MFSAPARPPSFRPMVSPPETLGTGLVTRPKNEVDHIENLRLDGQARRELANDALFLTNHPASKPGPAVPRPEQARTHSPRAKVHVSIASGETRAPDVRGPPCAAPRSSPHLNSLTRKLLRTVAVALAVTKQLIGVKLPRVVISIAIETSASMEQFLRAHWLLHAAALSVPLLFSSSHFFWVLVFSLPPYLAIPAYVIVCLSIAHVLWKIVEKTGAFVWSLVPASIRATISKTVGRVKEKAGEYWKDPTQILRDMGAIKKKINSWLYREVRRVYAFTAAILREAPEKARAHFQPAELPTYEVDHTKEKRGGQGEAR